MVILKYRIVWKITLYDFLPKKIALFARFKYLCSFLGYTVAPVICNVRNYQILISMLTLPVKFQFLLYIQGFFFHIKKKSVFWVIKNNHFEFAHPVGTYLYFK